MQCVKIGRILLVILFPRDTAFERAYNFGVPFLMLLVHGFGTTRASWFRVITQVPRFTVIWAERYQLTLRGIMASMLIGHGGLWAGHGEGQTSAVFMKRQTLESSGCRSPP